MNRKAFDRINYGLFLVGGRRWMGASRDAW